MTCAISCAVFVWSLFVCSSCAVSCAVLVAVCSSCAICVQFSVSSLSETGILLMFIVNFMAIMGVKCSKKAPKTGAFCFLVRLMGFEPITNRLNISFFVASCAVSCAVFCQIWYGHSPSAPTAPHSRRSFRRWQFLIW